jgi:hypothetical protein
MKAKIVVSVLALTLISYPVFAEEMQYCQGMVCSTTPPDQSRFANFDIKDDSGNVITTIWGSIDYYGKPNVKTETNNATCSNCNVELQPEPVITEIIPAIAEISPIINDTATALNESATVLTDTTTGTITLDTIQTLYAKIMALINQLTAIIAKMKG